MSSILPSDLITPFLLTHQNQNDTAAAADWTWKETPHSHIFKFDLPGYSKSDINIQIHTDTRILHITTKTVRLDDDNDAESKNVTWHCRERVGNGFSKKFRLPKDAMIDRIEASMNDGVLVVTVAKEKSGGGDVSGENGVEAVKKRSVVIECKDEDRRGGKGAFGKCFVCFKS